ncbi:DUF11 domain-containing protein [Streptomyces sp. W1SF4]|uniref:DUF11 domain-containing protein n=1 Tax=Streptomyces sp. W1SF4 TaxID=2305220 RepID=UPI000F6FB3BF|nr:DUF11 domain-containing protein [Streptomyces sp. W1SF4]AZM92774.1 DUF11 domain-containing protein [Streptomyces sp. W1SF4]
MAISAFRRRVTPLSTTLGLGIVLPFAVGVAPAYAQAQLDLTKSHAGEFRRGGHGFYQITLFNNGDQATDGGTHLSDVLPPGLSAQALNTQSEGSFDLNCGFLNAGSGFTCDSAALDPGEGYTIIVTVDVAQNAPCTVTNTVSVTDDAGVNRDTASDPTAIPGNGCSGSDDGGNGGASILPVNLSGVIPMFNNITTNNNIGSPGASNTSGQGFDLNAP